MVLTILEATVEPERVDPERFGLRGIRRRAALMGGAAEIESSPGHGTSVCVTLPMTISESVEPMSD